MLACSRQPAPQHAPAGKAKQRPGLPHARTASDVPVAVPVTRTLTSTLQASSKGAPGGRGRRGGSAITRRAAGPPRQRLAGRRSSPAEPAPRPLTLLVKHGLELIAQLDLLGLALQRRGGRGAPAAGARGVSAAQVGHEARRRQRRQRRCAQGGDPAAMPSDETPGHPPAAAGRRGRRGGPPAPLPLPRRAAGWTGRLTLAMSSGGMAGEAGLPPPEALGVPIVWPSEGRPPLLACGPPLLQGWARAWRCWWAAHAHKSGRASRGLRPTGLARRLGCSARRALRPPARQQRPCCLFSHP